jgi:hypothetical protein
MAPLNGAFGLSSGRLIALRFDEGDALRKRSVHGQTHSDHQNNN